MPISKLHSMSDIYALKDKITLFDRPASFRVELLSPNTLDYGRLRTLERRLAFCLSDCGCGFASVSIILIPLTIFLVADFSLLPFWPNTVIYVLSTLAGALLAKLGSLIISYHLAHRTIDELISSLTDVKSTDRSDINLINTKNIRK